MQRISSRMTFFYKRVFPIILLVLAVLPVALPIGSGKTPPFPVFLMPVVVIGIGYVVLTKLIFDMVDEVWDAGDFLIVRNKNQEDRIPLSAIINVGYSPLINPPRVTLTLRTQGIFGDTVAFCAPVRFMPFAANPLVDDLIRRIDAARRRAR